MGRAIRVAAFALLAGCGAGGGGDGGIDFGGDVNEVVLEQTAASAPPAPGFLAGVRAWLFPAEAVAQSGDCPEGAREVLVCAATLDPEHDCEEIEVSCRRMNASSCRFDVGITIDPECTGDGRRGFAFPFFVQDVDGDGEQDESEPSTSSLPFGCSNEAPNGCSTCNGDVFFWHGVSIDFEQGEAGAAALEKRRDACGPTPTPAASPTATPEPTATPLLP